MFMISGLTGTCLWYKLLYEALCRY